jgi:hypothetical protein
MDLGACFYFHRYCLCGFGSVWLGAFSAKGWRFSPAQLPVGQIKRLVPDTRIREYGLSKSRAI